MGRGIRRVAEAEKGSGERSRGQPCPCGDRVEGEWGGGEQEAREKQERQESKRARSHFHNFKSSLGSLSPFDLPPLKRNKKKTNYNNKKTSPINVFHILIGAWSNSWGPAS